MLQFYWLSFYYIFLDISEDRELYAAEIVYGYGKAASVCITTRVQAIMNSSYRQFLCLTVQEAALNYAVLYNVGVEFLI